MFASSQLVPSVTGGFEHVPLVGSHTPTRWHASLAVHTTGFAPTHVPLWHVSVCVHALPSSHVEPSATAGVEQTPVVASQVPTAWHASPALHTIGFEPTHTPEWQASVCVHALPSLQLVPSGNVVHVGAGASTRTSLAASASVAPSIATSAGASSASPVSLVTITSRASMPTSEGASSRAASDAPSITASLVASAEPSGTPCCPQAARQSAKSVVKSEREMDALERFMDGRAGP